MLSRSVHKAGRCLQFVEECDARILAKTGCSTEEREKKLQGCCIDVGDVAVVCGLCCSPPGKSKSAYGSSCTWVVLTVFVVNIFHQL